MTKARFLLPLLFMAFTPLAYADNIAACEAVLMEPVEEDGVSTGAEMASFRPAVDFMSSVYDNEDGHIMDIDGYKIRGIMCERKSVIPNLRDFPIIATGLPFSLSQNFDTPDSDLMSVYYKDGQFRHVYKGDPLSENEIRQLLDVMEVFNLQPHDLDPSDKMERLSQAKQKELE